MAPTFVACRICYQIEGKLKNYTGDEFYIQQYENLTGEPFEDLPYINKFCPSCAYTLKKYYKFRKLVRSSHYSLTDYLNTGRKVTQPFLIRRKGFAQFLPVKLDSWKTENNKNMAVIDCIHSTKRCQPKQKLYDEVNILHMAVPKDPEAEIQHKREKPKSVDDHFWNDDYYMDYDVADGSDAETPATEDVDNPAEPLVVSVEPETQVLDEVKAEGGLVEDILDDVTDQKDMEVKCESDPDNLTLQEIKNGLRGAAELDIDEIIVKVDKRKKGAKKKEKEPKLTKKSERLSLRAKRQKSNQDLEDHFTIETFLTEEEQYQEFLKRRQSEGYLEGRYKCELCLKSFKEQKWMDTHVKKHEPPAGTHICAICKIRCRTPKLFRTHRDANHTTKYSCKRCVYVTFSKAQALKHHGWHEGVEHACQHCGATFRKHTTYMGHLRRAHPSSYICGVCARSFVSAYGLNLHIKAVHKDINKLENDSTKCEECDVTFVSHKMYIRHILITDKHKEMSKDILGCRKCGEQFPSKEAMEGHTHYKERKYVRKAEMPKRSIKCDECEEVFSHPNGVYQHYLREHPDKPYQFAIQRHYLCEQCGKTFKSPGLLQQHALIHKGLRPPTAKKQQGRNSCRLCGKTYSKLSGLFRHKLTHLGVRRHKCHICEKAFTDTSNLKQHVQGVHLNIRRVRKR